MTPGPTFGSPSIKVVVENIGEMSQREQLIPEWVIAGVSVALYVDEVDVSPAIITGADKIRFNITPRESTKIAIEYSVIVVAGDEILGPKTIRWNRPQKEARRVKVVEFTHSVKPPLKIVSNVIRRI
jgi:hypothetical protein